MNGNKIYHVEFYSGSHCYFGSISAIYDTFDDLTLGIKKDSLYAIGIEENRPYRNKICTIRRGRIVRKKGNRKGILINKQK